ncbi:hypothetical protein B484DRAFT_406158 [Ochromonadaceae sp. CCMP2298]|nr:hypothetical protein B484DRAFT_406158 [Ochromonadaceae sp. CCMP2298]
MVALREREEAEDQEDTYQMDGNYLLDRGGRCSMATYTFDGEGTGVDYGDTPDTTPVREDQGGEIMNEEGEAQADEEAHPPEAIPVPSCAPSPAQSLSPHRINDTIPAEDTVTTIAVQVDMAVDLTSAVADSPRIFDSPAIADAIMKSNPNWDEPADKAMERKYPTGHPTSQRSARVDRNITGAMIKVYRRKMKKAGNLVAPEPSPSAPRECFHMWVPTKPPPDLVQARAKAFSIPKKPPPPQYDTTASEESEEEGVDEKEDERQETAIEDPVSDDSSSHNDTSTTPTHHIPHIEAWLIHANLERLAQALASNFRVHPDVAGDYSPGSKNDKILGSRNGDPTQWPEEWSYIPRTYLYQHWLKFNKQPTARHNLPAIWLAYYLSYTSSQVP